MIGMKHAKLARQWTAGLVALIGLASLGIHVEAQENAPHSQGSTLPAADAVAANRSKMSGVVNSGLKDIIQRREFDVASADTRILSEAALAAAIDGDFGTAERWLGRSFGSQDMNVQSPTFGQMRSLTGDANVALDTNIVEFNAQALGPLLNGFGSKLSPGFLSTFQPHISATIAGVERHQVPVTYTNMFLAKMVNLILLGQYAGDSAAVRQGEAMISEWIRYTRAYGITEFDSPVYYKTDINSLVEGYRYASNHNDRKAFATMLDYIWTDIAANYMPSSDKLTGPTSRGYDLMRGLGGLNGWIEAAGWSPVYTWPFVTEQVFLYDNQRPGGYWPSAAIHKIATTYPRAVVSSRADVPTQTRWNWVSSRVAIGCTSGDVHGNDTTFSGAFAGPGTTPLLSIMVDAIESPYGLVLRRPVPYHQASAPGCVQKDGTVLVTMDLDPHVKRAPGTEFTTNILLPKDATILQGGQALNLNAPGDITVDPRSVISATLNGGTIALRFIEIDPINGAAPAVSLSADTLGLAHGAVRLKITHLRGSETTTTRDLRIALLLVADDQRPAAALIEELRAASLVDNIQGDTWTVAARVANTTLGIQRSVTDRKTIFGQMIDGQPAPRPVLSVNGADLSTPIWSSL